MNNTQIKNKINESNKDKIDDYDKYSIYNNKYSEQLITQKKTNKTQKTYKKGILNIGTHNIRGLNNEGKQKEFRTFYKEQLVDIIGLTETKLNRQNNRICINNINSYSSWWKAQQDHYQGLGVGIMVKKELAKHVTKVFKSKGRIIAVDMLFRGKQKLKIVNVYIESKDADQIGRLETLSIIENLIKEGKKTNSTIIIMRDFNADPEKWLRKKNTKNKVTKTKYKILELLNKYNFVDTQRITNIDPLDHTWDNRYTKRRLDQIWITNNWSSQLIKTKVFKNEILETDQHLVTMKLLCYVLIDNRTEATDRRMNNKRTIFQFNLMIENKWQKYEDELNNQMGYLGIRYKFNIQEKNEKWLNETWATFDKAITNTANKCIPIEIKKKINKSNRPKILSNTLTAVKQLIKISCLLKKIIEQKVNRSAIKWE